MSNHSRLGFHMGGAFCRVASDYPTITDVILEQVQNAIDANASIITVKLNRKTRHVAIRDNGDGVNREDFEQALRSVCQSGKAKDKLGRFGIGLISPLDKCQYFTFTSCHKSAVWGYKEWRFVTEDIRSQASEVLIPHIDREDLFFVSSPKKKAPNGKTAVLWRTEVNIFKYSDDKMLSRVASASALSEAILERFGAAMRRKKVVINIHLVKEDGSTDSLEGVKAKQFTGRALKEVTIEEASAGRVTFRLFLAPKTTKGQHGKVIVGESDNDYRLSFNMFARSAERLLPEEVSAALRSGVFEGEILCEKVELSSTRTSFEKNDAFVGMCLALETWFKKHGAKYLDDNNEERRDQRYQQLGLQSLSQIENMLKEPIFSDLLSVLEGFALGNVGVGHTPPEKVVGKQSEATLSTRGLEAKKVDVDGGTRNRNEATTAQPKHHPFTSAGPRGQQRALVRRDSVGLQFSYITMDGSDRLWELDCRQGVLHFNVSHPIWVSCDGTDRKVRQLQETVAINALILQAMPEELQANMRFAFDEALPLMVYLFHSSAAFVLRNNRKSST